ncbi:MAG: hypothetical protein ACI8RZ_000858 [Myxococcota bacterium]|jgi:hypothetical protein
MNEPISCPILRAFLSAENKLPPLKYTRTPIRKLLRHARSAGAPVQTLLALPALAILSDGLRGTLRNLASFSFDLSAVMGGPLDKGGVGGTGALRSPTPGVFDAAKFERAFHGFSRTCTRADGVEEAGLLRDDLVRLARANRADFDGSLRTQIINTIELTALVDVFGLTDRETGEQYVSTAEMRTLFEQGRLPERY